MVMKIIKQHSGSYLYRDSEITRNDDAKGRYCYWSAYVPAHGSYVRVCGRSRQQVIKAIDRVWFLHQVGLG